MINQIIAVMILTADKNFKCHNKIMFQVVNMNRVWLFNFLKNIRIQQLMAATPIGKFWSVIRAFIKVSAEV